MSSSWPKSFLKASRCTRGVLTSKQNNPVTSNHYATRCFHASRASRAHAFFAGIASSRMTTPWIDAFHDKDKPRQKATAERDMKPKKMSDSYHRVVIPLAQDKWLSDTYINATGHLRIGAVLLDLDSLAGYISEKHAGEGVSVVTAACDRINIENPLADPSCDLEYSGQVTYARGGSSMEVTCKVGKAPAEGEKSKPEDVLLTCMFTMVALDYNTRKSTKVPALDVTTPEEKDLYSLGQARSEHKKALAKANLLETPPNAAESSLIHSMWLQQRSHQDLSQLPANVHTMASTQLADTTIMQPEFRNKSNYNVFGGFLMKHTFELAFCCCASFAHARPSFVSLDPSTFMNPVPVGSVLYLNATVAYTDPPLVAEGQVSEDDTGSATGKSSPGKPNADEPNEDGQPARSQQTRVQIRVDSHVKDVEHGQRKPTGQFNYTFTVDKDVKVVPQTYEEFVMYLEARRRVDQVDVDKGKRRVADSVGS